MKEFENGDYSLCVVKNETYTNETKTYRESYRNVKPNLWLCAKYLCRGYRYLEQLV